MNFHEAHKLKLPLLIVAISCSLLCYMFQQDHKLLNPHILL
nr:MAG TPA: hypothetical protein [Caudoviricetes sp.]